MPFGAPERAYALADGILEPLHEVTLEHKLVIH